MGNSDEDVSLEDRFGDVLWLANTGIHAQLMRDEAFCQLAKQVTGNPSPLAAERGWALMGVLLYAFHPSQVLLPHLEAFVDSAPAEMTVLRRFVRLQLARARRTGSRSANMSTGELRLILTVPSRPLVFGASLNELMATPELVNPDSGLPRILECLVARVVDLGGDYTEGLFRVSADSDAVAMTRLRIEAGNLDLSHIRDPNVPASLLKEWLRDLAEPLVPESLYERCVRAPNDPETAMGVLTLLPPTALHVLKYLLNFLARLLRPEVQARTRMDGNNLALIFGPTLLRNPASDLKDAFMTTSGEQAFVLTLLEAFKHP
ncbi:RhoGAP-domain-containing protein [Coemansia reversa NRRL 1564]|uniref:RhoGAP-domain-containing protein n=1 Tax=Coemansia reversa (strain ATCC 12441 / NRRL 1564) TaxID=763665 RepID=A0A2G5BBA9_COERN|nr:RhoGAP-domain-containing protein [Coemansia reversa NRRL 1564]|eukprot:PIA16304.1 RhoGAP-domain-containing protein [Coemansia reversa NRRL 1564]